jgi:hypothetical protein
MLIEITIVIGMIFNRGYYSYEKEFHRAQRNLQIQQVQTQQKVIMSERQINTEKILEALEDLEK